ncbi:MAG: hypothetical protein R3B95_11645 [Nitrospirales bacterium]|nr:hypothetical protein [Nitrospirales bacterium]
MSEPTNQDRAVAAEPTIMYYVTVKEGRPPGEGEVVDQDTLTDLLTDLFHFASQNGLDMSRSLRLAESHFGYEESKS